MDGPPMSTFPDSAADPTFIAWFAPPLQRLKQVNMEGAQLRPSLRLETNWKLVKRTFAGRIRNGKHEPILQVYLLWMIQY
jgi:hypothetical protein